MWWFLLCDVWYETSIQDTQAQSLGQEDPLQKEMATHSSTLDGRISWTEEPAGLQTTELWVRHNLATKALPLPMSTRASLLAQTVKRLPVMRDTGVRSLGQEDPLEKEMATHSSTLSWQIPWTEEPGRLLPMGVAESRTWLKKKKKKILCVSWNVMLFPDSVIVKQPEGV